jgi:phosphotransferase system HPr-like phosphotransfer protein
MAADYDAFISIENLTRGMPQKGVANAKLMWHLLALGARQGDQLRIRATGVDAETAIRGLGGLIESPGLTRISRANRSLEKVDPQRMRAAEIFSKFTGRAGGGDAPKGLYIVGEIGKELFVPNRLTHLIPKKVMDQIPKAAGGMQIIGQKPNSLFAPPEDGIIVPNRLMDQVPHAARGKITSDVVKAAMARANEPGTGAAQQYLRAIAQGVTIQNATITSTGPLNAPRAAVEAAQAGGSTPSGSAPPGFRRVGRLQYPESEHLGISTLSSAGVLPEEIFEMKKSIPGVEMLPSPLAGYKERVAELYAQRRAQPIPADEAIERSRLLHAGAGQTLSSRTPRGAIAAVSSYLFGGVEGFKKEQVALAQSATHYNAVMRSTKPILDKYAASAQTVREQIDLTDKGTRAASKSSEEYNAKLEE